jgi:hypothetical protein
MFPPNHHFLPLSGPLLPATAALLAFLFSLYASDDRFISCISLLGGILTSVASETEVLSPEYCDEFTDPFLSDIFFELPLRSC